MKFSFLFLLFTLTYTCIYAQITVTGTVKDESGLPVPFASAALIQASDSILVRGSLTDENGLFKIENVSGGPYRILASFLGYENVYSDIIQLKPESKTATVDIFFLQKGILLDEIGRASCRERV